MTTTESKKLTITLSDRSPISIKEDGADECIADLPAEEI